MTDYRSRAGDARRSGRAGQADRPSDRPPQLELRFELRSDGCLYVVLGRADVGLICQQAPGIGRPGWNWLCMLPEQRATAQFAADLLKAKDAMRSAVETWCEAAGLCAVPRRPRGEARAWRAEGAT